MKRLLVINADDLGLSPDINSGILWGIGQGFISDSSVMVKAPYAEPAIRRLKALGIKHTGIHINLDDMLGWKPGGIELKARPALMEMLDDQDFMRECAREAREQIEIFLSFGLIPTHLDTHHHVHGFSSIFEVLVGHLMEYGIPALRFSRHGYRLPTREDISYNDKLYAHMEEKLKRSGIYFSTHFLEGACKIADVDQGVTELVVHPSMGGELWRSEELKIIQKKGTPVNLERNGIELVSFHDVLEADTPDL